MNDLGGFYSKQNTDSNLCPVLHKTSKHPERWSSLDELGQPIQIDARPSLHLAVVSLQIELTFGGLADGDHWLASFELKIPQKSAAPEEIQRERRTKLLVRAEGEQQFEL